MSLPPLVDPAPELSIDEVRRYSRHLILPEVGLAGLRDLRKGPLISRAAERDRARDWAVRLQLKFGRLTDGVGGLISPKRTITAS